MYSSYLETYSSDNSSICRLNTKWFSVKIMATIDWPIILDLALNKFVNDNKIIRKMLTDDGQIPNNQKLPVKGPKLYGRTRLTLSYLFWTKP